MQDPEPQWTWTVQRETAARLLAEGELGMAQIAAKIGVNRRTITFWKKEPEFQERIHRYVQEIAAELAEHSIAAHKAITDSRLRLLAKVEAIVDQITADELAAMKKNPIGAINLLLRLQTAVDALERRRKNLNAEYDEEDDYPFHDDLSPEAAERIVELIEHTKAEENPRHPPKTDLRRIRGQNGRF